MTHPLERGPWSAAKAERAAVEAEFGRETAATWEPLPGELDPKIARQIASALNGPGVDFGDDVVPLCTTRHMAIVCGRTIWYDDADIVDPVDVLIWDLTAVVDEGGDPASTSAARLALSVLVRLGPMR